MSSNDHKTQWKATEFLQATLLSSHQVSLSSSSAAVFIAMPVAQKLHLCRI